MDASVFIRAAAFGATVAATIGPIALLIVNVAAVDGLARGLRASLGAAAADLAFAAIAFAGGYAVTAALATHRGALTAVASAVLIGFGCWMIARALGEPSAAGSNRRALAAPFVQTFALTIVNPLGIVVFMGLAIQLPAAPSLAAAVLLSSCVFAGSLVVQVALALFGALVGRVGARTGWLRALNLASGAGVVAFGVVGLLPLLVQGVSR